MITYDNYVPYYTAIILYYIIPGCAARVFLPYSRGTPGSEASQCELSCSRFGSAAAICVPGGPARQLRQLRSKRSNGSADRYKW